MIIPEKLVCKRYFRTILQGVDCKYNCPRHSHDRVSDGYVYAGFCPTAQ